MKFDFRFHTSLLKRHLTFLKAHFVNLSEKKVTFLFFWYYVIFVNLFKNKPKVNILSTFLLSQHSVAFASRKWKKGGCKMRYGIFRRTSGHGEARVFIISSEFTSGNAVKVLQNLAHNFCAYLCIRKLTFSFKRLNIALSKGIG